MRTFLVSLCLLSVVLYASVEAKKVKVIKRYVVAEAAAPAPEPVSQFKFRNVQQAPKVPKPLTEYDLCKMECKKQRDAHAINEYVDQLKAELAVAEAQLAEEEAQKAVAAQAVQEQVEQVVESAHDTAAATGQVRDIIRDTANAAA